VNAWRRALEAVASAHGRPQRSCGAARPCPGRSGAARRPGSESPITANCGQGGAMRRGRTRDITSWWSARTWACCRDGDVELGEKAPTRDCGDPVGADPTGPKYKAVKRPTAERQPRQFWTRCRVACKGRRCASRSTGPASQLTRLNRGSLDCRRSVDWLPPELRENRCSPPRVCRFGRHPRLLRSVGWFGRRKASNFHALRLLHLKVVVYQFRHDARL